MTLLSGTTLAAWQAGSFSSVWVAQIEGYRYLLSDAPAAAVVAAYAGTDWDTSTNTLAGGCLGECLFVDLHQEQSIDPWNPFGRGGTCILRVMPNAADTFGIDVARRAHGAETSLGATIDRDDTAISLAFGSNFSAAPSTAFIGTECIKYSGVTSTTMTASQRGMYSPLKTGTGGAHFANHHRVGLDPTQVQMDPVISQDPRVWVGKRVSLRMHKWDGTSMNAVADSHLVFTGRIASIADDPNTMCTVVEVKHLLDEIADVVLFNEQWAGQIPDGIYTSGGTATLTEVVVTTAPTVITKTTNPLTIAAGRYSGSELCGLLSNWLGGELAAGRITGTYSWNFAVSSPEGPRTKAHWHVPNPGSGSFCQWQMSISKELGIFLGLRDRNPQDIGAYVTFPDQTHYNLGTATQIAQGDVEPYRVMAFHFGGVEGLSFQAELENERGSWINQTNFMPTAVKTVMSGIDANLSLSWGLFFIDDRTVAFGTYDSATHMLGNVYLAPLPQATDAVTSLLTFGRKVTDAGGPVTVRQVCMLEGPRAAIIKQLFYSTGTAGYNHATYDTLGYALGMGIPGEVLGTNFEQSLDNLPGALDPIQITLEEPTKLSDVLGGDLMFLRAFPVWKQGGIRWHRWQTPVAGLAVAALTEDNKAAPANADENHRSASLESNVFQRPIVKIDYNRDFSFGRDDTYLASITLEDQTAVDDGGGEGKSVTIKLRNVYAQSTQAGEAVESRLKDYIASMPMFSRAARKITRSIALPLWEAIAPGDIVTVTDSFMRDPLTGQRNGPTRAATVVRVAYDPGGLSPDGSVRQMTGEADLFFLDTHRGGIYGPAALIDSTVSTGGFTAGYNSGTKTIRCVAHQYSESSEAADASWFPAGTKALVTEIDPSNTASPKTWSDTVASQSGNDITLTTGLAAYDTTKTYRVTFDHYSLVTTTQQDYTFEADVADEMIENVEVADHYSLCHDATDVWTANSGTDKAEFLADQAMGDGKTHDAGYDTALVNLANMFIDYKSAHQSPFLLTQLDEIAASAADPDWQVTYVGVMFFGTEQLSNDVWRYVTMAPRFRLDNSGGATTGRVRITIAPHPPVPSAFDSGLAGSSYNVFTFEQPYVSNSWSTTSTTEALGSDWSIALNFKDGYGMLWIMIEKSNAWCRGIGKMIEGKRNTN